MVKWGKGEVRERWQKCQCVVIDWPWGSKERQVLRRAPRFLA